MKKLFAIVLGMALMFSSFTARAEAISLDTQTQSTESQISLTDSIETKEVEDGKLTLELLQQMSSWEELVNTAIPISDSSYKHIENKEDFYTVMLINGINHKLSLPVYHSAEYISHGLGGIKLKEIDYDRLMQKYQTIIDIYNASDELQLVWNPKILNENYMQVDITSTNVIAMKHPATKVGQQVVLKQGATYWESAWNDGSGKYGIATDTNRYIPEDYIVTVNGFAYYLDESRTTIMESYYKPYDELGEQESDIKPWKFRMVHICTETTDLGWVYAEDVVRVD